jgi:2,3-bisphosphoglycerate-independent phosphoglycerate mutase
MKQGPHALVILDGFGYRHAHDHNAIHEAHPEHYLRLLSQYPSATLKASGTHVGLLPHMIGNSEVGHLTIGSGRIIKQPVSIIHDAIADGSFFQYPLLVERFKEIAHKKQRLHLLGLLSDGGVHSHEEHFINNSPSHFRWKGCSPSIGRSLSDLSSRCPETGKKWLHRNNTWQILRDG